MKRFRVWQRGRQRAQTKHDLMYIIGQIKPCDPFAIYDGYLYSEYVERLRQLCERYPVAAARHLDSPTAVANSAFLWLSLNQ